LSYLVTEPSLIEVYFGPQGFKFFSSTDEKEEIEPQFTQSTESESWDEHWTLVGLDTELGDPYIVNTLDNQVYTAIFNIDTWELIPVASTFESFVACMSVIRSVIQQNQPVFIPEEHTIQDLSQLKDLEQKLISTSGCEPFWHQFITAYIEWLSD